MGRCGGGEAGVQAEISSFWHELLTFQIFNTILFGV